MVEASAAAVVAAVAQEGSISVTGRTLGYGLLGGAALLALLIVAWLAVSGAQGGGIVLGLVLLVILAGPLALAGFVIVSRQPAEAAAEAAFASKRRVIEADRLFRRELAPELRQAARQPGLPTQRLEDLAEDLERSTYDTAEWYDAVQLSDDDMATMKRYEDLVWDRVRSLRSAGDTEQRVRELEEALDQRRDLLIRGRRAPTVSPSVLARSGAPARGADALRDLALADAVTAEGIDYLVESVGSYFAEGQTWKLAHLSPAEPAKPARWLYVGPAASEVALLDEAPPAAQLPQVASGTASVDVTSKAGSARGALVTYARFAGDKVMAFSEQWPDGSAHTYAGDLIDADDVEVWPAQVPKR